MAQEESFQPWLACLFAQNEYDISKSGSTSQTASRLRRYEKDDGALCAKSGDYTDFDLYYCTMADRVEHLLGFNVWGMRFPLGAVVEVVDSPEWRPCQ